MRVGTMFLGRVEALDHESIQTKFFVLGVPLVPMASFYATAEHVNGVDGIEIPVHGKSVLAGYGRIGLFAVAALTGIFAYVEHRSYHPQYGLMVIAAAATVAWAALTFVFGRLSSSERMRRQMLRSTTGIGAPPEILDPLVRAGIAKKLRGRWTAGGGETTWKVRLKSGDAKADEVPLLYAMAEYEGDEALAAIGRARLGI
jgi:hypothetical protein